MDAYVERKIIDRVAEGDETAFRELFNEHRGAIYKTAFRLTESAAAAEDVLQEVFLIVWIKREELSSILNFRAYLQAIARNHIIRSFKRLSKQRDASMTLSVIKGELHQDTEDVVQEREFNRILQSAVATLSPRQAAVYSLIRDKGFSREQAAAHLDVYPETVKSHMEVAMKKIRAYCLARLMLSLVLFFS